MIDIREERKEIRRLLWRWGGVTAFCARRQKELVEYGELIDSVSDIKPQVLTGMPIGSEVSSPTERNAERLRSLKERYAERIIDLTAEIDDELAFAAAVESAMGDFTPIEKTVLDFKYKHERRVRVVADRLRYSVAQIENIERGAVDKLRKRISVEYDSEKD